MSRLKFYEKSHRYRLDGEWTPSVTGIISGGVPKTNLLKWYADQAAEWATTNRRKEMEDEEFQTLAASAATRNRDAAANRGTEVHAHAERMALGIDTACEIPEEIAGHVEQAARFLKEWQPKFLHTEAKLFHERDNWCGTTDFIAEIPGYGVTVGDYKTNRSGLFATELSLQLAAYANATHIVVDDEDVPMPAIDTCLAVWIGPDNYEVRQIDGGELTYRYFRYVHQTYLWCKKGGLSKSAMSDPLEPAMQEAS